LQNQQKQKDPGIYGFPEMSLDALHQYLFNDAPQEVLMKCKRVAIYARVSLREKQETLNQLAQLREFCRRQGWQLVTEYVDRETGSVSTRADFQKMLLHASQQKFDVLLFWALDRLTREGTLATLQYLERLTSYQVGYKSFTEPYLDSCGTFKDVVISVLATMAKQERLRLGERVRAGLERVRRQGKKLGRPPLRVLTGEEIAKLRKERQRSKVPFRELSRRYGVSVWAAHRICKKHGQSSL
jgi:DNA invertase Pin-like site-specific DNA recombinase